MKYDYRDAQSQMWKNDSSTIKVLFLMAPLRHCQLNIIFYDGINQKEAAICTI